MSVFIQVKNLDKTLITKVIKGSLGVDLSLQGFIWFLGSSVLKRSHV